MIKSNNSLLVFSLVILVVYSFWGLTSTFYQQDEWHGLGDILTLGSDAIFISTDIVKTIFGQGRIFADSLVYLLIGKFPLNILPVALFAVFLHTLNVVLVYLLIKRFTKHNLISVIGALFFAFNAVGSGAVTWAASGIGTLPATTLILLALFSYFKFLDNSKGKWLLLTFIPLYFSLYFKEIGIFLFLLFPLYYMFAQMDKFKKIWFLFIPFIAFFVISSAIPVLGFKSSAEEKDLFLTGATNSYTLTIISRSIIYPLTSFSLNFIPSQIGYEFAKHLTWVYYPFFPPELYDLIAQSIVLDMLALVLTTIIIFTLIILFRNSPKHLRNRVIFWTFFILFSFLPYIIISKNFSYLESRYYYLSSLGVGILIGLFLERASQKGKNFRFLITILAVLLLATHFKWTYKEIENQKTLGSERINLLTQISNIKPKLDDRTIFYVTGDRNFYITEGNPTPMQQGMGYTLLTWYFAQNKSPNELQDLIKEYYLWEMNGQGYKEIDQVGYGYFWDLEKLKEALKNEDIPSEVVTGLYYDSKNKKILDITDEIF